MQPFNSFPLIGQKMDPSRSGWTKLKRKICPFVENLLKNIQYFSNEMIITFYFKLIDDKKG